MLDVSRIKRFSCPYAEDFCESDGNLIRGFHPCTSAIPALIFMGMRKVLKSAQQPLEIKPQEKSVWICMCGLSKNQPFCDGSHKKVAGEEDGKTYEYDAEGHRQEI